MALSPTEFIKELDKGRAEVVKAFEEKGIDIPFNFKLKDIAEYIRQIGA